MNDVFELEMPTLSQMIRAETAIGQEQGVKGVMDAMKWLQGKAPDADLILAALRQIAAIRRDAELMDVIDQIDDLLC